MNTCNNVCPDGKATSFDVKNNICTCSNGDQIQVEDDVVNNPEG